MLSIQEKEIEKTRGPGFWKLNTQLLKDNSFCEEIDNLIEQIKVDKCQFEDKRVYWDWLKYKVREKSIKYSKNLARQRKQKELDLQDQLDLATKRFEETPSEQNNRIRQKIMQEQEHIYNKKVEAQSFRAKVTWLNEGERSTKYFFGLEKRNYIKRNMRKLLSNGKIITNQKKILQAQKTF